MRNIELNGLTNCKVFDYAIGDKDDLVPFFIRPEKDTHSVFERSHAASPPASP